MIFPVRRIAPCGQGTLYPIVAAVVLLTGWVVTVYVAD